MCGIAGYFHRSGAPGAIGRTLLAMLGALARRGPDSAGVAVWGDAIDGLVVRAALAEGSDTAAITRELLRRARGLARVRRVLARGPFLRLEIAKADAEALVTALEADPRVEV